MKQDKILKMFLLKKKKKKTGMFIKLPFFGFSKTLKKEKKNETRNGSIIKSVLNLCTLCFRKKMLFLLLLIALKTCLKVPTFCRKNHLVLHCLNLLIHVCTNIL